MSIQRGRDMYHATRHPQPLPLDAETLRRSRIARGRAMHAARDDRDVRGVLASLATEDTETPPTAA